MQKIFQFKTNLYRTLYIATGPWAPPQYVCLYFFIRSSLTKQPQVKQQNKIGIYKMSTYITYIKDMHEHMNTYAHI